MTLLMNVLIGILIAVVSGAFASMCVVLIYHEEQKRKDEDPVLPIVFGEAVEEDDR